MFPQVRIDWSALGYFIFFSMLVYGVRARRLKSLSPHWSEVYYTGYMLLSPGILYILTRGDNHILINNDWIIIKKYKIYMLIVIWKLNGKYWYMFSYFEIFRERHIHLTIESYELEIIIVEIRVQSHSWEFLVHGSC